MWVELSLDALRQLVRSFDVRLEALLMLKLRFTAAEAVRAKFTSLDIELFKTRFGDLVVAKTLESSSFCEGVALLTVDAVVETLAADLLTATAIQKLGVLIPQHLLDTFPVGRRQELLNLGVVAQEPLAPANLVLEDPRSFASSQPARRTELMNRDEALDAFLTPHETSSAGAFPRENHVPATRPHPDTELGGPSIENAPAEASGTSLAPPKGSDERSGVSG